MKTKHYKTELALLAGNDLSESSAIEVRRHLTTCPDCRKQFESLNKTQQVLTSYSVESRQTPQVDLWSNIQEQLPSAAQLQRRHKLIHTWAPAATVIVACTVLFMVMSPSNSTSTSSDYVVPTVRTAPSSPSRAVHVRHEFDWKSFNEVASPTSTQEQLGRQYYIVPQHQLVPQNR